MSRSCPQNQFNLEGFCGFGFLIHPLGEPPPLCTKKGGAFLHFSAWFGPQLSAFVAESVPFRTPLDSCLSPSCGQYSLCNESLIELTNPGASGSIFYVTRDDEFIIKTVQHKEAEFLQKLLPGYYMVSQTGAFARKLNPILRFESERELARWLTAACWPCVLVMVAVLRDLSPLSLSLLSSPVGVASASSYVTK